jgi:hypothetical protein
MKARRQVKQLTSRATAKPTSLKNEGREIPLNEDSSLQNVFNSSARDMSKDIARESAAYNSSILDIKKEILMIED